MQELAKKTAITSLELVGQINIFRNEEGNRSELQHYDLLKVIRDEFEEEIGEGKISVTYYTDKSNRQSKCYELTKSQAMQLLVRESKFVRKAIIAKGVKFLTPLKTKGGIQNTAIALAYKHNNHTT